MKKLTLLLLLLPLLTQAQFNKKPGIVRYDFSTYTGDPIKTGWLFNDSTYRRLYTSYNAADTMVFYHQKAGDRLEKVTSEFHSLKIEFATKAAADRTLILSQQNDLGQMKALLDASQKDNADLLKQFWKIGGVRLHKGTCISIGVSVGILGYMAGKAF